VATQAILVSRPDRSAANSFVWELSQDPAPIGEELALSLRCRCKPERLSEQPARWEPRIAGYSYQLLDRDGLELLIYQWDPYPPGQSRVTVPHIHIGRSLAHPDLPQPFRQRVNQLSKAHLPTGFVTLSEILRCAIEDLGSRPRRTDWSERLQEAETAEWSAFAWAFENRFIPFPPPAPG
jgi:hypothetical protein